MDRMLNFNLFFKALNGGVSPLFLALFCCTAAIAQPSYHGGLESMSMGDLLNQRVAVYRDSATASAVSESLRDAPAAMVIIDQEQIRRRAYHSMEDLVRDLPGFDTVVTNGTMQVVSYQRGYRTPWTQRTLVLVNGKVDNNLWNHSAQFSRQYPMSSISRVEVLYGPASAVYGPNAFLGVINIVTHNNSDLESGQHVADVNLELGSFNSSAVDVTLRGKQSRFSYNVGMRLFESDEAPIGDYADWVYTNEALLSDSTIWGAGIGLGIDPATGNPSPVGDANVDGIVTDAELQRDSPLGQYNDLSENQAFFADITYGDWTLGGFAWKTDEGYGPYYSFADGQPNSSWVHESQQLYLENTTKVSSALEVQSLLLYRENAIYGNWAESTGNFVSLSNWNAYNDAWRFEQQYNYQFSNRLLISGGVKYEQKALTKIYMICNYLDAAGVCPAQAATSSNGVGSDGSGVLDAATISSINPLPLAPEIGKSEQPGFNTSNTIDRGVFGQVIYDLAAWRFNLGLRWDENSEYGSAFNPRGAVIYHWRPQTTFKLVYGEAFQEPSPKDLYGAFSGRSANPDLKPEKARNLELIAIHQGAFFLHDVSLYYAQYDNVIAGAQNVGERDIWGLEYRGQYRVGNVIEGAKDITGNFFYTYTQATASQQFDNVSQVWIEKNDDQGDIAPHKINFLVNMPLSQSWNLNVRVNWVSERELFSQNPLRADSNADRVDNRKAESFTTVDASVLWRFQPMQISLKIENLLEEDYLLPGVEGAGSGDSGVDNDGFQNSLIPQVNTRIYSVNFRLEF